jgi:hypothetical protein
MPEMRDENDYGHADQGQQTTLRVPAMRSSGNEADGDHQHAEFVGGLVNGATR